MYFFFFSSRRRHTRYWRDWSSDVCSSDLDGMAPHINPGGIFKEVSLVVDGGIRVRSLVAAADHIGRGVAHVNLYCRYNTRTRLVGKVRPLGFEAQGVEFEREVRLEEGENRFEIGFRLPEVRVWSTWDRGEQ